jgi:ribosome-binding factor A
MKINYQKETKTNFQLRKSSQLQKILMDVFSKSSFSFNNQKVFVNVVYVDLSKDLMNAKIVIDTFGLDDNNKKELVKRLNKDFIKQIRGLIAQKLQVKYVPEVIFCCQEENKKIGKVLDLIEKEASKYDD